MKKIDRSVIAGLPLFAGLSDADLDAIVEDARASRYTKDAHVFDQGAEARAFFLLLDGHIRVVRITPDGQQVIARYISKGELFGIAPAIGRKTFPANAVAAVDCLVLSWPTSSWQRLAQEFPVFASNTYAMVGRRLQESQDRVVEMSTEQVERRIAHALLRLVRQTGRKTEEGFLIEIPITRQDIAEMTGTTLHTVSRILSEWEVKGLVKSARRKVIVVEPHQLFLVAEGRDNGR